MRKPIYSDLELLKALNSEILLKETKKKAYLILEFPFWEFKKASKRSIKKRLRRLILDSLNKLLDKKDE